MTKLNAHLLPRIQESLEELRNLQMYIHKVARFYNTSYNVRRSEDVINPKTSHCDIMLLSGPQVGNDLPTHPSLYARALRIYHVYSGPGMFNYEPMRFDFLWVRWFQVCINPASGGWAASRLDRVSFPPMTQMDAFGFVIPEHVLRGCCLSPVFSDGKRHQDGRGLSKIAKDGQEWRAYYVNRSVNRISFLDIYDII